MAIMEDIEALCRRRKWKMTAQRRVIAQVLAQSQDHPGVEELYRRASRIDRRISLATVYRTVRLFEEAGILTRHDFGGGRARYEEADEKHHHDHMIDIETGRIIEFQNDKIEKLQKKVARELGYHLVGHRLELYGKKISS